MVLSSLCPDAERSRVRESCPGGGGNAGDLGSCGERRALDEGIVELDDSAANGEATKPACSIIGDGRTICCDPT